MAHLLGIDLGTSAIKVAVLDAEGRRVATATSPEMRVSAPQPGWAEQDPADWWAAFTAALAMIPPDVLAQVEGIGIAYQMHGLVPFSPRGTVSRPAIIWCDGRAVDSVVSVSSPSSLRNRMNNFTASKLKWMQDQGESVSRIGLPGDWLAAELTGRLCTTGTGISEMVGWDFDRHVPHEELWSSLGSPLPPIVDPVGPQGQVLRSIGVSPSAQVTYRAGDQPNNALALGVLEPGVVAASAGTSGVLYAVLPEATADPAERAHVFLHPNWRPSALLCVNGAGAAYAWLSRLLGLGYEELNAWASSASSDGVRVYPWGNGPERMLPTSGARVEGLEFNRHGQGALARATLEGIAFAMAFGAQALRSMGARVERVRAPNAGLFRSDLFAGLLAGALGVEIEILDTDGAEGAARAAGVGLGWYGMDRLADPVPVARRIAPLEASGPFEAWKAGL